MSFDLLLNAVIAGLLLGGFYAAVTSGVSLSFGILDIVNIAHPGFIILGSYITYIVNINFGLDPIVVAILMMPGFYALGAAIYQVYYVSFEKRGQESLRGLRCSPKCEARARAWLGRAQPCARLAAVQHAPVR